MSGVISGHYRELRPEEIADVAAMHAKAWQNPSIPRLQYEWAVKHELDNFKHGLPSVAFDAFLATWLSLPKDVRQSKPRVLDVGAAAGYYREVIGAANVDYTGCDYSQAFQDFARELFPDIDYDLADACALLYRDGFFDVVISGATIMHIRDYRQALTEIARVARRYVILHRTPVFVERPTAYYEKEAYGVPCLEIHFNELEVLQICEDLDLRLCGTRDVFWNHREGFGHRNYMFAKQSGLTHLQV